MLSDKRVLIVEDEWMLAEHLGAIVERAGGIVIGPVPSVEEAIALLPTGSDTLPGAATLNVKLHEDVSYPVADRLAELGIPFVFISANQRHSMPDRFWDRPLLAKPFTDAQVRVAIAALFD